MKKDYVPIYTVNGQLAGEMIRLFLESMNISVFMSQESAGIAYGLTVGSLGQVTIYVPADQVQTASELLKAMEQGKIKANSYPEQYISYPVYKNNKKPVNTDFTK